MAKERQGSKNGLEVLAGAAKTASRKGPPPVHLWDPAYCGEIDMRIAADGTWFYQGTPIGRPALVKLFAAILKREGKKYFLVTPVEKCGIMVEDADVAWGGKSIQAWAACSMAATGFAGLSIAEMIQPGVIYLKK